MEKRLRSFLDPDFLLDSPIFASPLMALRQMQDEVNRLFETQTGMDSGTGFPPVNVWAGAEGAIAFVEAAGIDPQSLDLSVRGSTLTLKGERKSYEPKEGERWIRRERPIGSFARVLELPFTVDSERVEAEYKDGVIKITLPRAEEDRPKKITIRH